MRTTDTPNKREHQRARPFSKGIEASSFTSSTKIIKQVLPVLERLRFQWLVEEMSSVAKGFCITPTLSCNAKPLSRFV